MGSAQLITALIIVVVAVIEHKWLVRSDRVLRDEKDIRVKPRNYQDDPIFYNKGFKKVLREHEDWQIHQN